MNLLESTVACLRCYFMQVTLFAQSAENIRVKQKSCVFGFGSWSDLNLASEDL